MMRAIAWALALPLLAAPIHAGAPEPAVERWSVSGARARVGFYASLLRDLACAGRQRAPDAELTGVEETAPDDAERRSSGRSDHAGAGRRPAWSDGRPFSRRSASASEGRGSRKAHGLAQLSPPVLASPGLAIAASTPPPDDWPAETRSFLQRGARLCARPLAVRSSP
jgi:hypothetical protein